MDLSTSYLGLPLKNPLVLGSAPIVEDLDLVKRLEDAGIAAFVMNSLFEEQIIEEALTMRAAVNTEAESFRDTFPRVASKLDVGPQHYLENLRRVCEAVAVPVIGSLNGSLPGTWIDHARLMAEAGAHAIELSIYGPGADVAESSHKVEDDAAAMLKQARDAVDIPIAVKLSPYYSSLSHFADRLVDAGAAGLVLFNRFIQPDFDIEERTVSRCPDLTHPSALAMRVRWIALLSGRIKCDLAVSGGVFTHTDVIKAVMAGADAVQIVSLVLSQGPEAVRTLLHDVRQWLENHEHSAIAEVYRARSLITCPDPRAFERLHYVEMLERWKDPECKAEISGSDALCRARGREGRCPLMCGTDKS